MKPLPRRAAALLLAPLGACVGRVAGDGYLEPGSQQVGEECLEEIHCAAGATCFEQTCVGEGVLRVSLAWDKRTDFDLHVLTPDGEEIYWEDPEDVTGALDVDDCVLSCRQWDGPHVESVYFNDSLTTGDYTVWVQNFNGRRSSDWWIEVVGPSGILEEWEGTLPQEIGVNSAPMSFTFE